MALCGRRDYKLHEKKERRLLLATGATDSIRDKMGKESRSQGRQRKLFSSSVSTDPKDQPKKSCLTHTGGTGDSVRLSKGQSVFVYSEEEAWREAKVLEIDSSQNVVTVSVTMENTAQVTSYSMDEVQLYWENKAEEVNNLTNINHVHEANVLSCLHKRFEAGLYYTYAGNTVVAVNPYTDVGHFYTLEMIQAYHHREQGLPPHIYTVAESSHMNLVRELGQVNQSIVISGESGAGKTVSAKHLLRYLTIVANPAAEKCRLGDKGFQIEQRVVDSNPILEAFGNAATTRNDNSSRFGKFIKLQFSRAGQIQGGSIQTYLLEKTRVMHQGQGENNFHVFYQMTRMTAEEENYPEWIRELRNEVADTAFLCVPHNQDCSENAELRDTLDAMSRIGLCGDSQRDIFQVLLAILYLGNLSFVNVDDDDSSSLEGSPMSGQALERSSQLLGLSPDLLRQTLLNRSLQAGAGQRQSFFVKPISIAEARSRRDILAMLLYSKLFEWLVEFINSRIKAEVFDNVIGLLDIYGFEIFPSNSLEQLCINYANERLQQHYVAHFLKNLQREYQDECLPWVPIDYNDNRPCLNLLDGRFGVFSLLNEEVYLNRKSDVEGLRDRLLKLGGQLDNCLRSLRLPAIRRPSFVVQHYAGDVHYTVSDLVPKNKDDIPADHISLLTCSQNPFVRRLFTSYVEPESPTGRKKKTVLTKFKSSLDDLMSSIEQSDVHYIRCLRPNDSNAPALFQGPYVLQQLRACGTIESVNICRKGFPARMSYWEFLQRYSLILRSQYCVLADSGDGVDGDDDDNDDDEEDKAEDVCDPQDMLMPPKLDFCTVSPNAMPASRKKAWRRIGLTQHEHDLEVCQAILERSTSDADSEQLKQQFGRSKLFLTEQQLEELECARLTVLHHSATCLQSAWRALCCRRRHRRLVAAARTIHRAWAAFQTRRWFLRLRRATIVLQRAWLLFRTQRDFLAVKRVTIIIQRAWVTVLARRRYLLLRCSVVVIQRAWRTFRTRKGFVRLKQVAVVAQRYWRTWKARREFLGWKQATVAIQRAWRARQTRRQFLELKKAAAVLQKSARQWLHKHHQPQQPPPTTEEAEDVTPLTLQPLTSSSPANSSLPCSLEQTIFDVADGSEACDDACSVDSGVMLLELASDQLLKDTRKGAGVVGQEGRKERERDKGERCERRCCLSATSVVAWACLRGFHVGSGVVSRLRIVKGGVRFHTRASVLRYGHVMNRWDLPQGLSDILTDLSYGGRETGCPVD